MIEIKGIRLKANYSGVDKYQWLGGWLLGIHEYCYDSWHYGSEKPKTNIGSDARCLWLATSGLMLGWADPFAKVMDLRDSYMMSKLPKHTVGGLHAAMQLVSMHPGASIRAKLAEYFRKRPIGLLYGFGATDLVMTKLIERGYDDLDVLIDDVMRGKLTKCGPSLKYSVALWRLLVEDRLPELPLHPDWQWAPAVFVKGLPANFMTKPPRPIDTETQRWWYRRDNWWV